MFSIEQPVSEGQMEIIHYHNCDIIVNKVATNADLEKHSFLRKLIVASIDSGTLDNIYGWSKRNNSERIQVDNTTSPNFLFKRKWLRSGYIQGVKSVDRDSSPKKDIDKKKRYYAGNSILSEFSIAKDVKRILVCPDTTLLLKRYGITALDFVEPILAVVDRNQEKKYLLYPFVDGQSLDEYTRDGPEEVYWVEFVNELVKIFEKNGVNPYDMETKHFLINFTSEGRRLYLVDAEMYYRIHKPSANI